MNTELFPSIVAFGDAMPAGHDDRVLLLGSKGANLIEMRQGLGLPVPPGFVLTTQACHRYLADGWSEDADAAVVDALAGIESELDRRFGHTERPLLVSVRSGAPRSMPGMLDTVLNVGINEPIAKALAAEVGDRDFAEGTWLRFVRLYAETVLGVAPGAVAEAAAVDDRRAAIEAVRRLADDFGGIPDDPHHQLRESITAVFRSWTGDRAVAFREREGIAASLGTACTVQAMVFGNLNERSGTGVVFTRDPSTGERVLYGNYLAVAQGEDVVSGTVNAEPIATLATAHPALFQTLRDAADRLELHYRDVCDIEFTVSDGTLYLLQTRVARRSPQAAVVTAVDMAEDPAFPLSRSEAIERVSAEQIETLRRARAVPAGANPIASGIGASPGAASGVVEIDLDAAIDRASQGEDVVLVRNETSPADVRAMMVCAGIITCVGGVGSHAAVVARGWGIPAVVGCDSVVIGADGITVGDVAVGSGTVITLDGSTGGIYLGDQTVPDTKTDAALDRLEAWRRELGVTPTRVGQDDGKTQRDDVGAQCDDEPGPGREANAADLAARATPLAVMRVVQFKGMVTIETIATTLAIPEQSVRDVMASLPDQTLKETTMGFMLTPTGRHWIDAELAVERAETNGSGLTGCYEMFTSINTLLKAAITTWQMSNQDDAAFDALVTELESIDAAVQPVAVEASAQVARLGRFGPRLGLALDQIRAGNRTMIASPLADSYHTVWFEFHEELIHLCGRSRLDEERREALDERG